MHAAALANMLLDNILREVPQLTNMANLDLRVVCNMDSRRAHRGLLHPPTHTYPHHGMHADAPSLRCRSRIGPFQWIQLAKVLHENRAAYDAFLVVHGTLCLPNVSCSVR